MSTANESYLLSAYAFSCTVTHRTQTSAMRSGTLVGAVNSLMLLVGSSVGARLSFWISLGTAPGVTFTFTAVAAVVTVALATICDRGYLDSTALGAWDKDPNSSPLLSVATEASLSSKETAGFIPLVRGEATQAIAESLFLAPGTIRAHTSNTYRKFDVRSRNEPFSMVDEARRG